MVLVFGKFLGHTIGDRSTVGHYWPEGSVLLVDLWETIELRSPTIHGIHGLLGVTVKPCLTFDLLLC